MDIELPVLGDGSIVLPLEDCNSMNVSNHTDWKVMYFNTTVHCLEHAPVLTDGAYTRAVVLGIMAVMSLVGNVLTIYSIHTSRHSRRHRQQSAMYSLILHLSVADLLVTVFCIAGEALWSYTVAWLYGNLACKLFKFLEMFSLYLSTFVLVLIGVDRFLAVRYPIKSLSTAKRCNRLVACAWGLAALLSLPQMAIFHVVRGPFYEEFYQCVTYGFYTERWQEQLYTTFSFMCMFIVPLIILISTYVSTIITISQSDKAFQQEAAEDASRKYDINRRRLIHRAKVKSFRISVVIVAAFIVWWTPYYSMMIIFMFLNPDKHLSDGLQKLIFFFGMSNSLVNPVIYGAFHLWRPKRKKQGSYRDGSTQQTANSVVTRLSRVGTLRDETSCVLLGSEKTHHLRTDCCTANNCSVSAL
ncbi:gonadotropin-releasing hormone receptor isoform X2 [Macrosteles quadrilineatus]|uniref:gonadotropin-releasing hormone receptor isoform X2 n=1 Tax=Macrosteles quadrilineatus TaxID=74068 RepID=UPI0023E10F75|nr:gonadotropin-releasing hormone receptor isoform X2 [Macrosteles quadrilineatus]